MTPHLLSVLQHTSRNGRYVTDEPAVFEMAAQGYLRDHGTSAIWSEGTRGFTLSAKGREALNEHERNYCCNPQPKPKRKRRVGPAFRCWRDYCDANGRLGFSKFLKLVWPEWKRHPHYA